MSLVSLYQHLKHWFFEPRSPLPFALFRIFLGVIVLQDLVIMLIPDFQLYYGNNAVIPIDQSIAHWWQLEPYFDLMLLLPPAEGWRLAFLYFAVILALMMTLGLFFRFTSVALWLCIASIDNHFLLNQNSGDVFIRLALMIICMSRAGDTISLDSLIRACRQDWRKTGFGAPLSAPWAQRMMQMQLAFVYFHSTICKIQGSHWINGEACYYASRYEEMERFPLPFLFENLWACKLLTWYTLVTEFSLFTLVWFREATYWVILAGLFLHAGIEYTTNLPMFEWLFMTCYVTFVEPEDLANVMAFIRKKVRPLFAAPYLVTYDGQCILCVRTVGIVHRLDIFQCLKLVDFRNIENEALLNDANADFVRMEKEMLVQTNQGFVGGFLAYRFISRFCPLLWPIMPVLYVPGISFIGTIIYGWIANHRYIFLGSECEESVCLQPKKRVAI